MHMIPRFSLLCNTIPVHFSPRRYIIYILVLKTLRVCDIMRGAEIRNTVMLAGESAVPCYLQSAAAGVKCRQRSATVQLRTAEAVEGWVLCDLLL